MQSYVTNSVIICKQYLHMVHRTFWLKMLEDAWLRRGVVWLSGVRRVGKTFLCQSLDPVEYFDCELPSTRRMLQDPEVFLNSLRGRRIALDEIHRLDRPSEVLKIAADHYPDTQVIATGSSTLAASTKFGDTLTGRKVDVWLTPVMTRDLVDFAAPDVHARLLRGGLPPHLLLESHPEREFQDWMDAYWAKDIQELFRLGRRQAFTRFAEMLIAQSGGIFEASRFARACEVSRPTITNYLRALEDTFVVHVLRPFHSHKQAEIVAAPKVYGFDTGFVCYYKGWNRLRDQDLGLLWEHFVLNEIYAQTQSRRVQYWRDKRGHEVDFVLPRRGLEPLAIECKWSAEGFDPKGLAAFRRRYPAGENFVVAGNVDRTFNRRFGDLEIRFAGLEAFIAEIKSTALRGGY